MLVVGVIARGCTVAVRGWWVVAVVVVWLLLLFERGGVVVGHWTVASKRPACASVRSIAVLSASACGEAAVMKVSCMSDGRKALPSTHENMKKIRNAARMIRPSTSQRAQLFHALL
jgi:hypothetical protein